jgi:hypothetical protein
MTYPAYTAEMVLKMPWKTFLAMFDYMQKKSKKENAEIKQMEKSIPKWPLKSRR